MTWPSDEAERSAKADARARVGMARAMGEKLSADEARSLYLTTLGMSQDRQRFDNSLREEAEFADLCAVHTREDIISVHFYAHAAAKRSRKALFWLRANAALLVAILVKLTIL